MATTNYTYPTIAELTAISQVKTPVLTAADPIFRWFPLESKDATVLMWEQLDNFTGLQQIRGIDGQPPKVQPVALNTYLAQPGVYGEFIPIAERELTERRVIGSFGTAIDVTDLVLEKQDQLLNRQFDRIRQILWTLASTGTFSVTALNGAIVHTDTFTLQTFTASPTWATVATAHPLADFRAVRLLGRGKGVSFGTGATAVMNQTTYNNLMSNTNAADLGGRRLNGLVPVNSETGLQTLLTGDGLPNILVYDDGYQNDSNVFVPFVADNKVVVFGQRAAGQNLGAFRFTRNANNPNMAPGPYEMVVPADKPPMGIDVHRGFNGGPVIFYPGSLVVMSV